MHEGQATSNSSCFTCGAHEVLAAEACIAMNLPVVFLWEDDRLQESRVSSKPVAWKPYPEGKILLTIGSNEMIRGGCVYGRRESYTKLHRPVTHRASTDSHEKVVDLRSVPCASP